MPRTIRMTEKELVTACLAENRFAQRQLYDQYKDAMFTLAYRIAGDFGMAEEILQDAFLKVFRGLKGFRFDSTLGAWIKIIVVRTAYSRVKKKIYLEPEENIPMDEHLQWSDNMDVEYLEKAIMNLPDGYRSVFTLVEVEGYSHKEVGQMLDISEGTSKSQLFYAKRKLRAFLENHSD